MKFSIILYDDSGSVYLSCRADACYWETEIDGWNLGWDLDSINELAAEHQAEAHPE